MFSSTPKIVEQFALEWNDVQDRTLEFPLQYLLQDALDILYLTSNNRFCTDLSSIVYLIYFYFILLVSPVNEQWIINKNLIGRGATTAVSQLQWSQSLKDM